MSFIIAIDPGLHCSGKATFQDGVLIEASVIRTDKKVKGPQAWFNMGKALSLGLFPGLDMLVLEIPQIYAQQTGKDPNHLFGLVGSLGALLGGLWVCPPITAYRPREWKGNTPKKIHQKWILGELSLEERAIVEKIKPATLRHNAVDAVGIGLFYLKRMDLF